MVDHVPTPASGGAGVTEGRVREDLERNTGSNRRVKGFRAGGTKAEEAVVTCNEWEVRIERRGHGALAADEAGELEAHLAECAPCRAYP